MGRAFEYRRAAKEKRWDKMSKLFPKLGKAITMAAKEGGDDPAMNAKLRTAIQNAKAQNMPKDNIDAAVKRATQKDLASFSEIIYEGKGPHGVLVYVECATDNSTRTVANVKSYFNKVGGAIVPNGQLEFMFSRKSVFELTKKEGVDPEEIELELIDAGCELDSYASDITRTFPVNGKFSGPQKTLYEIVLAAQQAAMAATKPGLRFIDGHDAAVKVLSQGMLDTGLLDKNKVGTLDDVLAKGDYRHFYMHRTGHWLGMDVHDVGDYRDAAPAGEEKPWRTLQAGMVLTIEPGIYVRPTEGVPEEFWNIGIRIEDDALVTAEGCKLLTHEAPKTIAEIEAVMRDR